MIADIPTLETARLRLRPFTLDDADDYYAAILSDRDVRRYLPGGQPRPRTEAEPTLRYFINQWTLHGFGGWAVARQADDRLIGQCGLGYIPDSPDVELYYAFAHDAWGQGFATEAARAALRFGFETAHLDAIFALFMPENRASERVMIKLGMVYQGTRAAYGSILPCYRLAADAFDPTDAPYRLLP